MHLEAVIALKTRSDAKRRLSADLTDEARESLVEAMALDVIAALSASPAITAVHVICGDGWAQLEELPAPVRVWREPDEHSGGLVGALEWVAGQVDSDALLFVHGDLPFIDASDIASLASAAASEFAVVSPIVRRRGRTRCCDGSLRACRWHLERIVTHDILPPSHLLDCISVR